MPDQHIPVWMEKCFLEIGQQEIIGAGDNPRILEYQKYGTGNANDDIPWCADFVNWGLGQFNIAGTKNSAARSFLNWGDACNAKFGCISIFRRGTKQENKARVAAGLPEMGHVAFYLDQNNGWVSVLGGNQSNRVGVGRYPLSDNLGFRWPQGLLL